LKQNLFVEKNANLTYFYTNRLMLKCLAIKVNLNQIQKYFGLSLPDQNIFFQPQAKRPTLQNVNKLHEQRMSQIFF
jgi:hypothetical protein